MSRKPSVVLDKTALKQAIADIKAEITDIKSALKTTRSQKVSRAKALAKASKECAVSDKAADKVIIRFEKTLANKKDALAKLRPTKTAKSAEVQ